MNGPGPLRLGTAHLIGLCHYLIIPYALLAWLWPEPWWLITHAIAMPLIMLQWRLNNDTCILNNIETWLRTGSWRDDADPNQGSWIAVIIERITGLRLSDTQINWLTYGLMTISWAISVWRLIG